MGDSYSWFIEVHLPHQIAYQQQRWSSPHAFARTSQIRHALTYCVYSTQLQEYSIHPPQYELPQSEPVFQLPQTQDPAILRIAQLIEDF